MNEEKSGLLAFMGIVTGVVVRAAWVVEWLSSGASYKTADLISSTLGVGFAVGWLVYSFKSKTNNVKIVIQNNNKFSFIERGLNFFESVNTDKLGNIKYSNFVLLSRLTFFKLTIFCYIYQHLS